MAPADPVPPRWPDAVGFWCNELDHRAVDPAAVRTAALTLTKAAPGPDSPGARGFRVERLLGLDPLRDRPLLDDDPDGAVLVDILLSPLSAAITAYTSAAQRVRRGDAFWRHVRPLTAVEHLLARGSLFATPECRVRLEGRARYNLAFDAAALRATVANRQAPNPPADLNTSTTDR